MRDANNFGLRWRDSYMIRTASLASIILLICFLGKLTIYEYK